MSGSQHLQQFYINININRLITTTAHSWSGHCTLADQGSGLSSFNVHFRGKCREVGWSWLASKERTKFLETQKWFIIKLTDPQNSLTIHWVQCHVDIPVGSRIQIHLKTHFPNLRYHHYWVILATGNVLFNVIRREPPAPLSIWESSLYILREIRSTLNQHHSACFFGI